MPKDKKERSKKRNKQNREYLSSEEKAILQEQITVVEAQPDVEKREAFIDGTVLRLIQELHKEKFAAAKLMTDRATMDAWAKKSKVRGPFSTSCYLKT